MPTELLPDDRALRYARRERALAAMADADLDVLVLGRPANVRYVAGAPLRVVRPRMHKAEWRRAHFQATAAAQLR
jgi:hypothetical protein